MVQGTDINGAARFEGTATNGRRHEGAKEVFDRTTESPEAHASGPACSGLLARVFDVIRAYQL